MKLVIVGNDQSLDKCLVFLDDQDDEDTALPIAQDVRISGDVEGVVHLTPQQEAVLEDVIYKQHPYMG